MCVCVCVCVCDPVDDCDEVERGFDLVDMIMMVWMVIVAAYDYGVTVAVGM